MNLLVQAIISACAFHGNECANIVFDKAMITDTLGIDDEERVDEILKLFDQLRHQLGSTHQVARDLLRLIKYER